jgi:hypothetical protein
MGTLYRLVWLPVSTLRTLVRTAPPGFVAVGRLHTYIALFGALISWLALVLGTNRRRTAIAILIMGSLPFCLVAALRVIVGLGFILSGGYE